MVSSVTLKEMLLRFTAGEGLIVRCISLKQMERYYFLTIYSGRVSKMSASSRIHAVEYWHYDL